MVVWFDCLWWGYVALWAALLIHCLLKRTFFPIFGPGWGTKVFWLITFVFMNPLLTLLYLVFGVVLSHRKSMGPSYPRAATVCLVLTILVIGLFELPESNEPAKDVTVVRSGQEHRKHEGLRAQFGALQANNSISTATSNSGGANDKFCAESVVIQNKSDHLLIDKVCRTMQAKIAELPYVAEVQYWPAGAEKSQPLSRGDIFIVVEARDVSIHNFGIKRTVGANILCHVGTEPLEKNQHSYYRYAPPVIQFSMNCHLEHHSIFKGFETSKARYQQQSEDMAKQLIGAMTKQFDRWIEKYGLLPELPDYLYTQDPNVVPPGFLADRDAVPLYEGGGLLIGSRSLWTYEDNRTNIEAFKDVRDTLQEQGWQGGSQLDRERKSGRTIQGFTMRRDNERLQVFRTRGRSDHGGIRYGDSEQLEKKLPIGVEYLSLLPSERTTELLSRFFKSDADIDAKLVFQNFGSDENLRQLLVDSVQSSKIKTMKGYLLVGWYYVERDETDKATEALMLARALGRADRQHNPAHDEIKKLARKIGDESLATVEVPVEYYEQAGFVDLAAVEDKAVFEREVGEPLVFYAAPLDHEDKIKTIAITIGQVGADDQYEVTTVEKQKGSSSVGTRTLAQVTFFNDPRDTGKMFHLEVEKLEGDRFELTFRRGRDFQNRRLHKGAG